MISPALSREREREIGLLSKVNMKRKPTTAMLSVSLRAFNLLVEGATDAFLIDILEKWSIGHFSLQLSWIASEIFV